GRPGNGPGPDAVRVADEDPGDVHRRDLRARTPAAAAAGQSPRLTPGFTPKAPSPFLAQRPRRYPVRHGLSLGPVGDRVGDQSPPVALLADTPAAQPALR